MAQHSRRTPALATRQVVLIIASLIAAIASWAPAASAAAHAGCQAVHVGPEIAPGAPRASYFRLTVTPGASTHAALVAANPEPYSCGVELVPAYGKTALNSGDTYPISSPSARGCATTSCWLSGLPVTITIPAGGRVAVPLTVTVPTGTPGGEYLAGVIASPSAPPAAPQVSDGHAQVGAAVVARVAIGVAITVPGTLAPQLTIPSVKIDTSNPAAVLNVAEQNGGNSWEHPHGEVLITTSESFHILSVKLGGGSPGRSATVPLIHDFGITSATILPGDSATLPLAIGLVPRGTWPTEVRLWYDHHRKLAVWRGKIGYPEPPRDATVGQSADAGSLPIGSGLPAWAMALIGGLAAVSVALGGILILLLRRRRRQEA